MTKSKDIIPQRASRQPTATDRQIGQLLRDRRTAVGLSQVDLAARLGITQAQLQKYESGENRISVSRLVECAHTLDVPVHWFFQSIASARPHLDRAGDQVDPHEQSLLDAFRGLPAPSRAQLIEIARVLGSDPKTRRAKRS